MLSAPALCKNEVNLKKGASSSYATSRDYLLGKIWKAKSFEFWFPLSLQALEVIKQLKESIPIARAQMRIKLCVPKEYGKKVRDRLVQNIDTVETEEWDTGALEMVTICCIFRDVVLEETYIESSGNF